MEKWRLTAVWALMVLKGVTLMILQPRSAIRYGFPTKFPRVWVFSRQYPNQRCEPSQFYNAPIELPLKWWHTPSGKRPVNDYDILKNIMKYFRYWGDTAEAHVSSHCFELKYIGAMTFEIGHLRKVVYILRDAMNKGEL